MTYVFDTSSLIGAWFRTYPPDVFPRLWENMDGLARSGRLLVPEEVMFELKVQDDDLLTWVKDRADLIVISTSRAVMLEARAILVDHKYLTKAGTGRGRADPFVIALAAIRECSVVTQERPRSEVVRLTSLASRTSVGCAEFHAWQFSTSSEQKDGASTNKTALVVPDAVQRLPLTAMCCGVS